ncbi:MAG: hypothetical protein AAB850_01890 [Patescibacteria group bacterium]
MYLLTWSPKVSVKYASSVVVVEPALHFVGTLRCPVCNCERKIETSGHLLGGLADIAMNIKWEFENLTKARECTDCGVVSAIPKTDREKIQREACKIVTVEWVKEKIEELKQASKKKAA